MKEVQTSCGCGCAASRGTELAAVAVGAQMAAAAETPESALTGDTVREQSKIAYREGEEAAGGIAGIKDRAGMIKIPGGAFRMGTDDKNVFSLDGEGPSRLVTIDPFYIDETAVTNAQFLAFVDATGYVTEAEQYGWSFVFHLYVPERLRPCVTSVVQNAPWWWNVAGAYWGAPEGPGTSIEDRLSHPAVHISWHDASAYAKWAGKRLPTEAEWEYAARGGLDGKRYPWGDELTPDGEHRCNIWQGTFPRVNEVEDGYEGTAPARSFEPNDFGLYNMAGNVWEWCSDWFSPEYHRSGESVNPRGAAGGETRTLKGGSYLCHQSYCNRYRIAARTSNTPDSSTGHMGFRCAADA
ncbi:formylglycine-generating enzyme family protein [Paenibacillus methanolicus]|uniref:Formylglycine-generating enzyme required for sulfatase activity n=1 Tax=Paenibacillus methanolicus TaxID=582686 RepID=A0A5S5CJ06_9BACL|nr:formylglycine-generating enzyme family protein [Paenibacillus methanolicus]TYP79769.1 formylglycine-generating enzyme required for sulfatase activity [Paenibacillus methanolicus]